MFQRNRYPLRGHAQARLLFQRCPCQQVHFVREFAHIHAAYDKSLGLTEAQGGGAGSLHAWLAPRDCVALIERGWAEWHPVADAHLPLLMVYAPRSPAELRTVLQVSSAPWYQR